MSVRIVENFWSQVKKNETVLRRCYVHHFNRHPDPDGLESGYNNLLVKFNEYGVFDRFELRKLVIAAHAEGLIGEQELTPELLTSIGINVQKKWEQFLYKWTEKVVNDEYNKNGKYMKRFLRGDTLIDSGIPQEDRSMWIEDRKEAQEYEEKFAAYDEEDRRGRKFPPTFSHRYIAGEEGFDDQSEALHASELRNQILTNLTGKVDRAVFELLEQGYAEKEISEQLGFSRAYAGVIIRKIRDIVRLLQSKACVSQ